VDCILHNTTIYISFRTVKLAVSNCLLPENSIKTNLIKGNTILQREILYASIQHNLISVTALSVVGQLLLVLTSTWGRVEVSNTNVHISALNCYNRLLRKFTGHYCWHKLVCWYKSNQLTPNLYIYPVKSNSTSRQERETLRIEKMILQLNLMKQCRCCWGEKRTELTKSDKFHLTESVRLIW